MSLNISGLFLIATLYFSIMSDHNNILGREHEEILEQLEEASAKNTATSKVFREMLGKFRHHLGEENDTIVPLLSYIKERTNGKAVETNGIYFSAEQKFNSNFDIMIKEHRIIQDLISKVQEQLKANPDEQSSNLSKTLLDHIELEEEFLYPAAKTAGEIMRLEKKTQ
jgi:hemerythrin superfamily protein